MGYNVNDFMSGGKTLKAAILTEAGFQSCIVTVYDVKPIDYAASDLRPAETKLNLILAEFADYNLPLNITNMNFLKSSFGEDTDGWLDKQMTLTVADTQTPAGTPTKGLRLGAIPVAASPRPQAAARSMAQMPERAAAAPSLAPPASWASRPANAGAAPTPGVPAQGETDEKPEDPFEGE